MLSSDMIQRVPLFQRRALDGTVQAGHVVYGLASCDNNMVLTRSLARGHVTCHQLVRLASTSSSPVPKSSRWGLILSMALGASTSSAIYLSWKNERARQWIRHHVPSGNDIMDQSDAFKGHIKEWRREVGKKVSGWESTAKEWVASTGLVHFSPPEKRPTLPEMVYSPKAKSGASSTPPLSQAAAVAASLIDTASFTDDHVRHISILLEKMLQNPESMRNVVPELVAGLAALDASTRDMIASKVLLDQERAQLNATMHTHEIENERLRAELQKAFQETLDREIRTSKEWYETSLELGLAEQAEELWRRWQRDLEARVEFERGGRLSKLEDMQVEFHMLKDRFKDVLEFAKRMHAVHKLRTAVDTLITHVVTMGEDNMETTSVFVRDAMDACKQSTVSPLVATVASTLPADLPTRGVANPKQLARRFLHVKEEIQKAALVPDNGGFTSHLVSRTLSPLLFQVASAQDVQDDTAGILLRAQKYIDEEDIDMAVREMNQLSGWGRALAKDWLDAARRFLEIRQAFEVMNAECSVASIQVS